MWAVTSLAGFAYKLQNAIAKDKHIALQIFRDMAISHLNAQIYFLIFLAIKINEYYIPID